MSAVLFISLYCGSAEFRSNREARISPDKPKRAAIPVLRPRLPDADALVPYLRRIDRARVYTNWGPLVSEFEGRLSTALGLPDGSVVSASSGTAGLIAAVLALAGRATALKPLAILPSYTFVATAVALESCGYQCFLADIDAQAMVLDPRSLLARLAPDVLARTGIVMPVASYGCRIDVSGWQDFTARTGIPVVIDAAACFETFAQVAGASSIPAVISLHATKALAAGEGGAVLCADRAFLDRCTTALNFGFHGSRESIASSLNGKMSEYHAAVGLAELDGWAAKRAALLSVAEEYRAAFATAGLADRFIGAPAIASCYALLRCRSSDEMQSVRGSLEKAGIDSRLWYGGGLHRQHYFKASAREALPVTDELAPRVLGLPVAVDLEKGDIGRIVDVIGAAIAGLA